jgi:hypothetical protein
MSQIVLDAEAGQLSAELARRGIPPAGRGGFGRRTPDCRDCTGRQGLDWLAEEPELYSDADLIETAR